MKDDNYIMVESWMINHLKLRGNDLLIFAFIHGFSWDKESRFSGSLSYIEEAVGASRPTVIKSLKFLLANEYIQKYEDTKNNIRFVEYSARFVRSDFLGSKQDIRGSKETLLVVKNLNGGSKETLLNNTNYTSSSDSHEKELKPSKIKPSMFPQFWELYPRKVDKGKAESKWNQICSRKQDVPTWREIRRAIKNQIKTERWQEKEFIPHPTTWLNQGRWKDDPQEMVSYGNYSNGFNSHVTWTNKKEGDQFIKKDSEGAVYFLRKGKVYMDEEDGYPIVDLSHAYKYENGKLIYIEKKTKNRRN